MKDKFTREVARMYKDLEFSVRADDWDKYSVFRGHWGDDSCCLGSGEHEGGQGGGLHGPQGGGQEYITREVAKGDKDMSRIWGQI